MEIIIWVLAFASVITIHEAAHGWVAERLGDPTARLMGRISLNPLVHYDAVGTTLLLVLAFLRAVTHNPAIIPFGWAKPVPFDPYNLKNPRRDSAIISSAGPAANLILALLLSIILRISFMPFSAISFLSNLIFPFILLNVALAIFNLIPVHPLDGGKILVGFLPLREAHRVELFLDRFGIIILFFLIFPTWGGNSPISLIIFPIINFILSIFLPGSQII